MSKHSMPGSMDLLLDTMCNTFGGVVFIAISLSLALVVCHTPSSPEEEIKKAEKELKEQQQESKNLEKKRASLSKKLLTVKELSSQYTQTKSRLPELVTKLEQDCRDLQRDAEMQLQKKNELDAKIKTLTKENRKIDSQLQEKCKKTAADRKKLQNDFKRLKLLADELERKLEQTPVKRVHFGYNIQTSRSPYILIVKNDCFFRLGSDYHHSSREVQVQHSGSMLVFTPLSGNPAGSILSSDLPRILRNFRNSNNFLWVIVHPDSFISFVKFRRILREAKIPVHWYIDTTLTVQLTDKENYSASY